MEEDISREGLTTEKLLQPLYLLRPKNNQAIAKVQKFTQISIARINELLGTEYRGAILDIDECTAPHHGDILPENLDHVVEMIREGTRIVIFSNMKASDRYNAIIEATNGAVKVHTSQFAKPDARGFLECCDELNLLPHQVVMIGDNFITDGGSIRAGIDFVKVESIKTEGESIGKKLKRFPQIASRWLYSKLSDLYDKLLKRKVLKVGDISPTSS